MKNFLVICGLLLSFQASAATLKSSSILAIDPRGDIFTYSFSIKNSSDLAVTVYSCWKTSKGEHLRVAATEWDCAEDQRSADIIAQKKADSFENNLSTKGYGG